MALRRDVLSNYPIYAVIEPTTVCNLRCPLCPTGFRLNLRQPRFIDWSLWKGILDDIGDYLFRLDMFNWGEPLLHKGTPEFVKYAKSKDIRVFVSSNLNAKLTEEYIQRLVESGLDFLVVSISGVTQETYEKYHRQGNISVVRDNMRRIQSAKRALKIGTPTVKCKFLLFRHNEHEVDMANRCYKDWGADQIVVVPAFTDSSEYDKRFYKSCSVSALEPSTIPECDPSLKESPARKPSDKNSNDVPCRWLYQGFVLNPNGKVSPCCAVWDEKDDFAEYSPASGFFAAYNSQRFQRARKLFRKSRKEADVTADISLQEPPHNCGVAVNTSKVLAFDKHVICSTCPAKWKSRVLNMPQSATSVLQKTNANYLIAIIIFIITGGRSAWAFAFRSAKARLLGKLGKASENR